MLCWQQRLKAPAAVQVCFSCPESAYEYFGMEVRKVVDLVPEIVR